MNSLIPQGAATITSQDIAELVGSRHDKVKQSIERLVERSVIESPPMGEIPTATRPASVYVFAGEQGKRDSIVVVAQLSPEFTARLVDRWQELEARAAQPAFAIPQTLPDALRLAADLADQKVLAEQQRDHAIATKAQIGSQREATAMATASAATRRAERLASELGQNARHATIIAVERATGVQSDSYDWRPLKKWCEQHGVTAVGVPCPRYGEAKAWPAGAWLAVYGVDLSSVFSAQRVEVA